MGLPFTLFAPVIDLSSGGTLVSRSIAASVVINGERRFRFEQVSGLSPLTTRQRPRPVYKYPGSVAVPASPQAYQRQVCQGA